MKAPAAPRVESSAVSVVLPASRSTWSSTTYAACFPSGNAPARADTTIRNRTPHIYVMRQSLHHTADFRFVSGDNTGDNTSPMPHCDGLDVNWGTHVLMCE